MLLSVGDGFSEVEHPRRCANRSRHQRGESHYHNTNSDSDWTKCSGGPQRTTCHASQPRSRASRLGGELLEIECELTHTNRGESEITCYALAELAEKEVVLQE